MRQWGMALCCAAAAAGIARVLAPGGALGRVFRMSLGAFFLCCLLSPLLGAAGGPAASGAAPDDAGRLEAAGAVSSRADQLARAAAEAEIGRLAEKKLRQLGINGAKAAVYINETTGQLTPQDIVVQVSLPAEYKNRHDELCRQLEYELGVTLRLEYLP